MGHSMSVMGGGAFGTSAAAPGTNSLGTALSSSGTGNAPMKGPLLGTSPGIDREEAKVDKMIGGICRGCCSRRAVPIKVCMRIGEAGRCMVKEQCRY